jgi:hypothetical protein
MTGIGKLGVVLVVSFLALAGVAGFEGLPASASDDCPLDCNGDPPFCSVGEHKTSGAFTGWDSRRGTLLSGSLFEDLTAAA